MLLCTNFELAAWVQFELYSLQRTGSMEKALRLDGVKNTEYGSGARTHAGSDSNRRGRLMSYNDDEMS